jgi:hypothetical protein
MPVNDKFKAGNQRWFPAFLYPLGWYYYIIYPKESQFLSFN